jgi:hypothetical protein
MPRAMRCQRLLRGGLLLATRGIDPSAAGVGVADVSIILYVVFLQEKRICVLDLRGSIIFLEKRYLVFYARWPVSLAILPVLSLL